uniref:Tyrosine-sulfated glycopeptide receptor 1 n=1 Tax=Aegilops tauschii TaxID=37682 RepID=M8BML4_AEGTA
MEVMRNLVVLNTSNNSFTGHIPPSLCLSPSLAILDLCYNQLSGCLLHLVIAPRSECSKVGHNNLSGTLPVELFHATSLEHLSFPNNGLQGELDGASIVKLSNLVTLDLRENKFSGKIPRSIGQLKRLEELYLGNNNMSGELPSTLSNCTHLMVIDLKINNLSGELGTVNFSTLQNLTRLDVLRNNFSGIVPENIYSCSNLIALRVSLNHFHGEISPRIGNLHLSLARNPFTNITKAFHVFNSFRNITTLIITENFVNEIMPQDETLDGFQNLQFLNMADSSLTGRLPVWLSKLRKLKVLKLSNNRLTGPMPGWINSLHSLFYLGVSNNSFTGHIPIALMEVPMLKDNTSAYLVPGHVELPLFWRNISRQYHFLTAFPMLLNLSLNNFTGVIPPKIGQLKVLSELDFSSNKLYGVVPLSVCNLTKLEVLDLSNNHLRGVIPAALESLHFLSAFNISNNDLEGSVPTGGQLSTFPNSSFDGNPKLCGTMLIHQCSSAEVYHVNIISAKQPSVKLSWLWPGGGGKHRRDNSGQRWRREMLAEVILSLFSHGRAFTTTVDGRIPGATGAPKIPGAFQPLDLRSDGRGESSRFYLENTPRNLVLQIGSSASVDNRWISDPMAEKLLEHLNLGAPVAPDIFPTVNSPVWAITHKSWLGVADRPGRRTVNHTPTFSSLLCR